MPENSRRVVATHRAIVSKVAQVPSTYAYAWLTDYREDDGSLSPSNPKFRVFRVSKDRVVRVRVSKVRRGTPAVAVELVRLRPPDAWHVDQIDERDLETVDYKLTRLGPEKCRIELRIVERWMTRGFPKRAEWVKGSSAYWDRLVAILEASYRSGRPATA